MSQESVQLPAQGSVQLPDKKNPSRTAEARCAILHVFVEKPLPSPKINKSDVYLKQNETTDTFYPTGPPKPIFDSNTMNLLEMMQQPFIYQ